MATTGYKSTGAYLDTGYGIVRIHGEIVYTWSRSNNTVSFTSTYARVKYVRESGGWTSFNYPGWTWKLYTPSGTHRRTNSANGTRSVNQVDNGTSNSFSVSVGANDTSVSARVGAYFSGDGETFANHTLTFGALGDPAGTTTVDTGTITTTAIGVRNDVTTWGSYATAGSVRSYRADNSGFTGQTYLSTTDNALITHTGLTPNTRYWFRGWAQNGGGKTAYHSSTNAVTKSAVYEAGTVEVSSNSYSVTNARVYQGYYTTSSKIKYRVKGTTTWSDSASATGDNISITINGLLPNTTYERRFVTTTTAGTTENPIAEFTTLPSGKIIYPDGTVKNAITRTISPDGEDVMVKVTII